MSCKSAAEWDKHGSSHFCFPLWSKWILASFKGGWGGWRRGHAEMFIFTGRLLGHRRKQNQTHNKRGSLQQGVGRQRRSDDRLRFIYARGSVAGFQWRDMEKPPVNLSSWHMMLTTLKKKKVWWGKNFSTYPKETEADQSRARRLGLVDRRYVFSISVPRSKGDEQICSLLSTSSSGVGGGRPMEQTRRLLCIAVNSMQDSSISQDKQSRVNKLWCVSMKTRCCCVVDASFEGVWGGGWGGSTTFTAGSLQRRTTKHEGGCSGTGSRSQRLSTKSDHFIKTSPVQRRQNLLPALFCFQSTGNTISLPFVETRMHRNEAPKPIRAFKSHDIIEKSTEREKKQQFCSSNSLFTWLWLVCNHWLY